jgi:hypothetical protein
VVIADDQAGSAPSRFTLNVDDPTQPPSSMGPRSGEAFDKEGGEAAPEGERTIRVWHCSTVMMPASSPGKSPFRNFDIGEADIGEADIEETTKSELSISVAVYKDIEVRFSDIIVSSI